MSTTLAAPVGTGHHAVPRPVPAPDAGWSRAAPAPTPRRRLSLLADLRCAELLTSLGLRMSLRSARLLLTAAAVAGPVLLVLAAFAGARFTALVLPPGWTLEALSVTVLPLLCGLSLGGVILAEAVGRQRETVSGHPNIPYFRALDVPATLVHAVYALPRLLTAGTVWTCVGAGVLVACLSTTSDASPWWAAGTALLVLLPVALTAVASAVSLAVASRPPRAGGPGVLAVGVGAAALGAFAGAGLGRLAAGAASRPGRRPGEVSPVTAVPGQEHGVVLLAGGVLLLVLALVGVAAGRRRLRARSFPLAAADPVRLRRRSAPGGGALSWAWMLWRQRRGSTRWAAERRVLWGLALVAGAAAGARAVGVGRLDASLAGLPHSPLLEGDPVGAVHTVLVLGLTMVGVALGETAHGDLGRHRFGRHLRQAVELGAPLGVTVRGWMLALLGPALLGGVCAGVAAVLVWPPVGVLAPALVLGGVGATVLADHLLPPPRTADGGVGEGMLTALLALVLASGPAALLLAGAGPLATAAGVALLLVGAAACLARRLCVLTP